MFLAEIQSKFLAKFLAKFQAKFLALLCRLSNYPPFNPSQMPEDTPVHADFKDETALFNSKPFSIAIGVAALLLLMEYWIGSGGKFVWVAVAITLAGLLLPLRAWAQQLWRKYASWVYRTAEATDAKAYFYTLCPERHLQLLNIIYADNSKETVSVRASRHEANKILDQKTAVKVRRDNATGGGAVVVVDCDGKIFWCTPSLSVSGA